MLPSDHSRFPNNSVHIPSHYQKKIQHSLIMDHNFIIFEETFKLAWLEFKKLYFIHQSVDKAFFVFKMDQYLVRISFYTGKLSIIYTVRASVEAAKLMSSYTILVK